MITLYYAPRTRAVRPRWLLEEAGAPYELARLDLGAGENKKAAYLRINPNGTVPTLRDGDLTLLESGAICEYLADRFPEKRLAPPLGTPARGLYYQWIHYTMATLEPPLATIFAHTQGRPEGQRIPQLVTEARETLGRVLDVIEPEVRGREFLVGDGFTAADVMVASTLAWAQMAGITGGGKAALTEYAARLTARPAFQRAMAD
jgi:glutathione S-transferase